jgi:hypothetical protein
MNTIPANIAQIIWEVLNAAHYDLTKGNPQDGINAIEEAIDLIESTTTN